MGFTPLPPLPRTVIQPRTQGPLFREAVHQGNPPVDPISQIAPLSAVPKEGFDG